jgi:exopolysaccharide biosynthesis polyprenyl glycosylphosphotransferase
MNPNTTPRLPSAPGLGTGVSPGVRRIVERAGEFRPSLEPLEIVDGRSGAGAASRDALYRWMLAGADALGAALALLLVMPLLGGDELTPAALALPLLVVAVAKVAGLYDRDDLLLRKTTLDEAPGLFQVATLFTLVMALGAEVLVHGGIDRVALVELLVATFLLLLGGRVIARALAGRLAAPERCLVIGDEATAARLRGKFAGGRVNARVVTAVDLDTGHADGGSDVIERPEEIAMLVTALDIERVIVAPRADSDEMLDIVRTAKALGVKVSVLPRIFEVVGSAVEFDTLDGTTVLGIRRFGLTRSSKMVKRALDLTGATLGLLVISPLVALIALAIRLDSRGPVLFRQTRVGQDGRRFEIFKFRTMDADADARKRDLLALNEVEGGLFKIADDPRITRVGRFLRRTSLDELPQLLNVLRGEMSLVGPRPLVVDEDVQIEGWDRRRLHLTPGMTGHWQIMGSARIPLPEMVKIDYLYVANWSMWSDVKILLRTVPYVLSRRSM